MLGVCSLLLDPKARGSYPLSAWVRELQSELDCQAITRQKLEEKVETTLKRGGATELRSSHALVRQLQGPLTNAIIREQRAVRLCSTLHHALTVLRGGYPGVPRNSICKGIQTFLHLCSFRILHRALILVCTSQEAYGLMRDEHADLARGFEPR